MARTKTVKTNGTQPGSKVPGAVVGHMVHFSDAWLHPVVIVATPPPQQTGQVEATVDPSVTFLRARLRRWAVSCREFPNCLIGPSSGLGPLPAHGPISVFLCRRGREALASGFDLADGTRLSLICACLPPGFEGLAAKDTGSLDVLAETGPPMPASPSRAQRADLVRAFAVLSGHVEETIRAYFERDCLSDDALRRIAMSQENEESLDRLLETPNDRSVLRKTFESSAETKALCHCDLKCDEDGRVELLLSSETIWTKAPVPEAWRKRLRSRRVEYGGMLRESWHGKGQPADGQPVRYSKWDYMSLESLLGSNPSDPLASIFDSIRPLFKQAYLIVGRTAIRVPGESCDINPACEARKHCPLFWETDSKRTTWRHRLSGIDLIVADPFPAFDRHRFHLILTAAAMAHRQAAVDSLEDAALRGLPSLNQREQKRLLRSLFDRCVAMEDPRQKGAAFERFTDGLLRLVPGWIVGRRNARDLAGTKEIDVTVFVEPSVPKARYWYRVFGAKVFIECKNYPEGLPAKIKNRSPVERLKDRMRRSGVRLGFLLNTGNVPPLLWREAEGTADSDTLIVVLDGSHVRAMIESPGDIEFRLKQRVSDADAGLSPEMASARRGRRRRRSR
jgi:hypothetical protein